MIPEDQFTASGSLWVPDLSEFTECLTRAPDSVTFIPSKRIGGAGPPTGTAPAYIGETFLDYTNDIVYEAVGTSTGTDWRPRDDQIAQQALGAGTGQTISPYGATSLTSDASVDETGTLGDGTFIGQIKTIVFTTDGGQDWDITISHHVTSDDELMTCSVAGQYARFWWDGDDWVTIDATCTFP